MATKIVMLEATATVRLGDEPGTGTVEIEAAGGKMTLSLHTLEKIWKHAKIAVE